MLTRLLIAASLCAALALLLWAARVALRWYDRRTLRRLRERDAAQSDGAASASGPGPRILYFTTETCVVCRAQQEPALRALLDHRPDIRLERVDAVAERALADEFKVRSVPTTAVYNAHGTLVEVNRGFAPAAMLLAQIEEREVEAEGGVSTAAEPVAEAHR